MHVLQEVQVVLCIYPALFILLRYTLYMQSVRKCFVLISGSTYLVLFIVTELQHLGALEAAAKLGFQQGQVEQGHCKGKLIVFSPQSLKLPLNCFLYLTGTRLLEYYTVFVLIKCMI